MNKVRRRYGNRGAPVHEEIGACFLNLKILWKLQLLYLKVNLVAINLLYRMIFSQKSLGTR